MGVCLKSLSLAHTEQMCVEPSSSSGYQKDCSNSSATFQILNQTAQSRLTIKEHVDAITHSEAV